MAMPMSIHQTIYETLHLSDEEVLVITGSATLDGVASRRMAMKEFLENNSWNEEQYMLFLRGRQKPLPSVPRQLLNLSEAAISATKNPKMVSEEEQQRRLGICRDGCEEFRESDERCSRCGCRMTLKVRLEAWHCPLNKW
jgi:hypothetical protein